MRVLMIDDMRNVSDEVVAGNYVVIARTYNEGIEALKGSDWDLLYLDHDLASFTKSGAEKTGYDIMCWLEQYTEHLPKDIVCVSSNPVGRRRIEVVINKLLKRHY